MSEQHFTESPEDTSGSASGFSRLLTPQASAIAGFAFAVFSMLGQGSWSIALTALFWGESYSPGGVVGVMVAWGIGCLLMAALAAWLAGGTLRVAGPSWEGHLARAAVLVAGVGAVLAVLTIVGGLVHGR